MAKNSAAGLLTSVDELFTTQTERDEAKRSYVTDLPASEISDFPNHPFKVRIDEERSNLTSPPLVEKLSGKAALSTSQIGKSAGESHEQVRRFIRLTNLITEILGMVDNSVLKESGKLQMALRPAVELSYLTKAEQKDLLETMSVEDCTPSHAQAIKMRKFSEDGKLNADVILSIMQEEKPN